MNYNQFRDVPSYSRPVHSDKIFINLKVCSDLISFGGKKYVNINKILDNENSRFREFTKMQDEDNLSNEILQQKIIFWFKNKSKYCQKNYPSIATNYFIDIRDYIYDINNINITICVEQNNILISSRKFYKDLNLFLYDIHPLFENKETIKYVFYIPDYYMYIINNGGNMYVKINDIKHNAKIYFSNY